ncbi:MAG: amidohydrolase [Thermoproteota archaeon]|jgi:predicted amidohydrolase YtcJ|nr:amidohydrolase [Thermoproteota archaeon]
MFKCFIGKIYVSFKPLKIAQALLIYNERIIYNGGVDVAERICDEFGGEKKELKNEVILPGFIDAHVHLDWIGETLNQLDLRNTRSIEELKKRLQEFSLKSKSNWIYGRGWDHELFKEKRLPTRWDIEEVVKDKPVMLSRVCGHMALLNTKALSASNLLVQENEDVLRDERNEVTGIIKENAISKAIEKYRDSLSDEELEKFLIDAMNYCASQGVTTIGLAGCSMRILKLLIKLNTEKKQKIRVRAYIRLNGNKLVQDLIKNAGIQCGFGDDMLKIMGFKIILDGALGIRSAYLSQPYSDMPNHYGQLNLDASSLFQIVREADEANLQIAIHAIGDKACDLVIEAYSRVKNLNKLRHRIEHASLLRDDQIKKIAELGIGVAVQPRFIISDWWAKERVGAERIKWLYAFKSMLNNNIKIGLSTDSPVEPLNPWETVYASITRGKYEGIEYYKDTIHEKLELEEALHCYTSGSAYIMHDENILGTLENNKIADFIIVDKDPFNTNDYDIKNIKVLETYIGGKLVFKI